ncbi:acyl-CoA dehydrogenase [Yamadazyma tenuis]|uniref:Acyl-CoA dehydrogenase NM domain-like protein n=1 Tax=Candida tenuis (strain ATCC 10573 / BCRC 21748 / CBS 615 / JCM 9827 / NBRC 10315 / NRRL Y-1498 / VKM Y-70) TaxID=590646 RepID=G3AXQ1_CANTC|nr:acyl-CoA dehydrogenase NM domain-like protein [Yamadazyma tenuis ATCC 10573]EGV65670.1 acyl-CoA dehydrogenase NM domain-like protein [Yamadazyma tenuis ATCC 10573]WEJ96018.1 acyl-CoA dehydrogenase [Yamadazyma tenuis]
MTDLDIPAVFLDKISPRGLEAIRKTYDFVHNYCIPADALYFDQISQDPEQRWKTTPEVTEKLKQKAKQLGLWNMFLSKHYTDGPGYTNLEYGLMAQFLGRSFVAPEATNTGAPDTGNMEILAKFGSAYHREQYLLPLLRGEIRSAFLMTEKGTSSSNALNISCSAQKNSHGNYVLNGVKWFASGAGDPRCRVWLVMCKTESSDNIYRNHSVLVLDAKKALASGKAKLIRPLSVFGYDDAPHGHCEVEFNDFEVPAEDMDNSILGKVGMGFEIIQSRLGPGRIHHCMRLIGAGEYALMRAVSRAAGRDIFGKPMVKRESFLNAYGEHKLSLQKCRLLVLNAAHQIDISNAKTAKRDIAMAKIETPRAVLKILDWCIQVYGAEGVSQDTELAKMYAHARTLRIADGPDEAHLGQLARDESKKFAEVVKYFEGHKARQDQVSKL